MKDATRWRQLCVSMLLVLFAYACHGGPSPDGGHERLVDGEQGVASWYGPEFDGKQTASGERFDMDDVTAAHRTLPFGTKVKVVDLDTNRSVIVRINDRGPFKRGRIIDLSRGAANKLGIIGKGTARVRLDLLDIGERDGDAGVAYTLQVASFQELANALQLRKRLGDRYGAVELRMADVKGMLVHRVYVGSFAYRDEAEKRRKKLSREMSLSGVLVVRRDWP